jgi:glycosyltransferase involved in cell wall biosynthesis
LLSRGEADPLVIKEALMAGLPVVTNRHSIGGITGIGLLYVDIIPDDKLDDMEYVEGVISENRKKAVLGKKIRKYAISQFSWEGLIGKYMDVVNGL